MNPAGNEARKASTNPNLKSHAVRTTLSSPAVAGALRNRGALHNPSSRAGITASRGDGGMA